MNKEEDTGSRNRDRPLNRTRRGSGVITAGLFLVAAIVSVLTLASSPVRARTICVPADSATIQAGIDGAVHGDTVLVADGIYTGEGNRNLDFLGKAIVVRSENGPEVTVISCGNSGRGVHFHNGEISLARLEGLTIRYGKLSGNDENGGGILIEDSSPTISNCIILGNRILSWDGGGIYAQRSSAVISNCIITGNVCAHFGGGLCSIRSSLSVINCTIAHNQATGQWWNYDECAGGGIFCDSIFVNNSIIWGNTSYSSGTDGIACQEYAFVSYSDIQGNWPGEGNINEDPSFRDLPNEDFHLMATDCGDPSDSPCIDAGDPDIADRILDCGHGLGTDRSDMGAYGGSNVGWPTPVDDGSEATAIVPEDFLFSQNYPNPFNAETVVKYTLPQTERIRLEVFNIFGQRVTILDKGFQEAGEHFIVWNASEMSSGIYVGRLHCGSYYKTIKMVVLK